MDFLGRGLEKTVETCESLEHSEMLASISKEYDIYLPSKASHPNHIYGKHLFLFYNQFKNGLRSPLSRELVDI